MMGVPKRDPKTPPLLIVNVPPVISSRARAPSLAWNDERKKVREREGERERERKYMRDREIEGERERSREINR